MEYLTSAECAKKWNVSQRWVAIYCKEGRVKGAVLRGRMWMIPELAEKPDDPRKVRSKQMKDNDMCLKIIREGEYIYEGNTERSC